MQDGGAVTYCETSYSYCCAVKDYSCEEAVVVQLAFQLVHPPVHVDYDSRAGDASGYEGRAKSPTEVYAPAAGQGCISGSGLSQGRSWGKATL